MHSHYDASSIALSTPYNLELSAHHTNNSWHKQTIQRFAISKTFSAVDKCIKANFYGLTVETFITNSLTEKKFVITF